MALHGIELRPNPGPDFQAFDLMGECRGRAFTLEVKYDVLATRTGNLAIEFFNTRQGRNSGILATKADLWVVVIGGPPQPYVATVPSLLAYFHAADGRYVQGGDDNSEMKLLPLDHALVHGPFHALPLAGGEEALFNLLTLSNDNPRRI